MRRSPLFREKPEKLFCPRAFRVFIIKAMLRSRGAERAKLAVRIISDYAFCKSWSEFERTTERALELLGRSLQEALSPEKSDHSLRLERLWKSVGVGESFEDEAILSTKAGRGFSFLSSYSPFRRRWSMLAEACSPRSVRSRNSPPWRNFYAEVRPRKATDAPPRSALRGKDRKLQFASC